MQHEEAEQKAGIDRQSHLNLGKAYLVEKAHRQKKSSMFTKSRRLCYSQVFPTHLPPHATSMAKSTLV